MQLYLWRKQKLTEEFVKTSDKSFFLLHNKQSIQQSTEEAENIYSTSGNSQHGRGTFLSVEGQRCR